ncbi:hypothetical protein SEEM030_20096, partial [Salmonella enterica subsp. enterica serovar Montevideo str. SARB30]
MKKIALATYGELFSGLSPAGAGEHSEPSRRMPVFVRFYPPLA